mgnify:CR=1 FL=1
MILFGLYHGLIVLPVLLSLIGPDPYAAKTEDEEEKDAEEADVQQDAKEQNGTKM